MQLSCDDEITDIDACASAGGGTCVYAAPLDGGLPCVRISYCHLRKIFAGSMSAPMVTLVGPLIRRGFKKHLFERGIARHTPDQVTAMGRADVDALATWLGDREWFVADGPTKADASAFGLLAVSIRSPLMTPVCCYARSKPKLVAFVDRALARFFPEHVAAVQERTAA